MTGPVFALELQQASRRGRLLKLWHGYAAWLGLQLLVLYTGYSAEVELRRHARDGDSRSGTAGLTGRFVNSYLEVFVMQHFALLLLATPTFVAGAITDEKTRGTLQFLLCADVSSWEIIAGKLVGRLAQVAFLAAAGLPFICFVGGFGALDAVTLVGLAGVTAGPLFGLGAASILSSVWNKETRDAVLRVYSWLLAGVLAVISLHRFAAANPPGTAPPGSAADIGLRALAFWDRAARCLQPTYVLEPSWTNHDHDTMLERLALALLTWGGIGVFCAAMAVWRLRPAYLAQLEVGKRRRQAAGRTSRHGEIGDDAVAWKERALGGQLRLPFFGAVPAWLPSLVLFGLTALCFLTFGLSATCLALLVPFAAVLLVGVRASACVSRERDQQTWETLLLTPLETDALLRGKVRGIRQALYPYLISYAGAAVVVSLLGEYGIGMLALTLLGAGWVGMYLMGAVGVTWSARAKSSWRSLLGTLVTGLFLLPFMYVGAWIMILMVVVPLGAMAAQGGPPRTTDLLIACAMFLLVFGGCAFAAVYFLRAVAGAFLIDAESWIHKYERMWVYAPELLHPNYKARQLPKPREFP